MARLIPRHETRPVAGATFRLTGAVRAVVLLTFLTVGGLSLARAENRLFSAARAHNTAYEGLQLELDLARLQAERLEIQARDRIGELQAAEALLAARLTHGRGLEEFYHEVIRAAYGVESAHVEERIAEILLVTAENHREQAELRHRRGIISEAEVVEARLDARSVRLDRDRARWNRQDAEIAFEEKVGTRWTQALLPTVPITPPAPPGATAPPGASAPPAQSESRDTWVAGDLRYARAEVVLELARLRRDRLPGNAPAFDRRIAEAEVRRADFELEEARAAAEQRYEQFRRRLTMEMETIQIRHEQLILREDLVEGARMGYERGMITAADRDQAVVRQLQARLQLLSAERDYLQTVVSRQLAHGLTPGEGE